MADFSQFKLNNDLLSAIEKIGFKSPTTAQLELLPAALSGQNIVGQSQTGSGKTHVFLINLFEKANYLNDKTQAVISAPSRELATQIYQAANDLNKNLEHQFTIQLLVGGVDRDKSIKKIGATNPQIVIGTPGRIKDMIKNNVLVVNQVNFLVVDEADMTLDMGFLDEVDYISNAIPKTAQLLVFSATIPTELEVFLKKYLDVTKIKNVKNDTVIADTISNWLLPTRSADNNQMILKLLNRQTPFLTLIFTNTKERAQQLYQFLSEQGMNVAEIHGGIQPRQRKKTMAEIKKLKYQVIVATDLAARGIDIAGVSEVINDGIPKQTDFFIHRVGRTGRNNQKGLAITLVGPDDFPLIENLENLGINFNTKQFVGNQLVDTKDYKQRANRRIRQTQLEGHLLGEINRSKKTVKPGYKKRIKRTIDLENQKNRRINQRKSRKTHK